MKGHDSNRLRVLSPPPPKKHPLYFFPEKWLNDKAMLNYGLTEPEKWKNDEQQDKKTFRGKKLPRRAVNLVAGQGWGTSRGAPSVCFLP